MKIRILGGGLYGCHLADALRHDHDVELHEIADRLFSGASGNMPARLHCGAHYPRSKLTRDACQTNFAGFMNCYGDFTHGVPFNVYAIANDSLVDFGTYAQIIKGEIECVELYRPSEFGIYNVEGALLTGERHVLVDRLRQFFTERLKDVLVLGAPKIEPFMNDLTDWDLTIDATFCANDSLGIDRYEVCLTALLEGPTERAITIMDGPFPSLYPWDEDAGLSSLTSARHTPIARRDTAHDAAQFRANRLSKSLVEEQGNMMMNQMAEYYPRIQSEYKVVDHRIAVRAMPNSKADSRLIDIGVFDRLIRIRAGKLDAIFMAEHQIKNLIHGMKQ